MVGLDLSYTAMTYISKISCSTSLILEGFFTQFTKNGSNIRVAYSLNVLTILGLTQLTKADRQLLLPQL